MRFLRAAEKKAFGELDRCRQLYPHIHTLVTNPYDVDGNLTVKLRRLKDHAVELARTQAMSEAELAQTSAQGASDDPHLSTRRKQRAARLLYRLLPGATTPLKAVQTANGNVVTEPADMAKVLRKHWAQVFKAAGVDETLLQQWVREDITRRRVDEEHQDTMQDVQLLREHMAQAFAQSNDSCPGPDGIPYGAWRALGDRAIDVLFDAALDLANPDNHVHVDTERPDFNLSTLLFLPKNDWGNGEWSRLLRTRRC